MTFNLGIRLEFSLPITLWRAYIVSTSHTACILECISTPIHVDKQNAGDSPMTPQD